MNAAGKSPQSATGRATPAAVAVATVSSVAITSSVPSNQNGHYRIGDTISVTATFNKAVTVTGKPEVELDVGGTAKAAVYASGSGAAALVFEYTVAEGDADADGIAIGQNKLTLAGGTVKDGSTDVALAHSAVAASASHKVDGVRPTITGITFGAGVHGTSATVLPNLVAGVQFSEDVNVTGAPTLAVRVGANDRNLMLEGGGQDSNKKYFFHTVQAGEEDLDGPSIGANSLTVPAGASIKDYAGNDAVVTHAAVPAQSNVKVDAKPPVKPTGFTATPGNTKAVLTWTDPGDESIVKWQLQQKVGTSSYGSWTDIANSDKDTMTHTVTGLTNGTAYAFKLRAVDIGSNEGAESDEASATPSAVVLSPPLTPTGFVATETGPARVVLRWTAPSADATRGTVAGYEIRERSGASGSTRYRDICVAGAGTTSFVLDGTQRYAAVTHVYPGNVQRRDPGETAGGAGWLDRAYTYLVRAHTGTCPEVDAAETRRCDADWDCGFSNPQRVMPRVTGVMVTPVGATSLAVKWRAAGGADGYGIRWKLSSAEAYPGNGVGHWVGTDACTADGACAATVTGFAARTEYKLHVEGVKERLSYGRASGEVTVRTGATGTVSEPVMSSAAVWGDVMRIGYSAALDGQSAPPPQAYSVTVDAAQRGVSGVAVEGRTVTLRLASPVVPGEAVTVDYAPPGSGQLLGASGAAAGGFSGQAVENDTGASSSSLSVADAAAKEGERLGFRVSLSAAASAAVTVAWATSDGTAKAGADYEAGSGTLTFAAGETEKTVSVALLEDTVGEETETLTLTLSNPSGAALGRAEATGTVTDVAPALPPLTARIAEAPSAHTGAAFTVRIGFSAGLAGGAGKVLREHALVVEGGAVKDVRGVDRRRDLWEVRVKPKGYGAVTLRLASAANCAAPGAVCTADGRPLSNALDAVVPGPVALTVADARAKEGVDDTIDFAVTLSRAAPDEVTVRYVTKDGSATAGEDYRSARGKLVFAAGETEKTVSVEVVDDAHDEGEETFTLVLRKASGAVIADGEAVGTIENSDHMPKAWIARFGRTVTGQVLDMVAARLEAPRQAGAEARLAGQALPSWTEGTAASGNAVEGAPLAGAGGREPAGAMRSWMARAGTGGGDPDAVARLRYRALTGRELLAGTSFALTGETAEGGGFASFWGRGAITGFDGREGELTLDGEVATGLIGGDLASGRWTAGLAAGHSRGTGGYREGGGCTGGNCVGEVEGTLTGVYPYAGFRLSERLSAWASAGWGAGELALKPVGGERKEGDLSMAMGAAGVRSELLPASEETGWLSLAVKADARFTRTSTEASAGLVAADADVWLVRSGLEGSRRFALGGTATLTPSFEAGVRLDGGDAETGFGADLGVGLAVADPGRGLTLDLKGRGLLAHEARGFREWGGSAALAFDPRPSTERGLKLSLTQSWGASPKGGMDALLGRETLADLAGNEEAAPSRRLEAELGYGLAVLGGAFTGTPNLGFALSESGRDWRLGWRLTWARRPGFELNIDAKRSEAGDDDAVHGIELRAVVRF